MGTDFKLRAATPTDAPAVHALAIQLRDVTDSELPDLTVPWVEHYLAQGTDEALIAEVGTEDGVVVPVGLLTYRMHDDLFHAGKTALVEELVVDEAWRSRGVGTALLEHVIRVARADGCIEVAVNTGFDNKGAQALYKRVGFTHESLMLGTHFSSDGGSLG